MGKNQVCLCVYASLISYILSHSSWGSTEGCQGRATKPTSDSYTVWRFDFQCHLKTESELVQQIPQTGRARQALYYLLKATPVFKKNNWNQNKVIQPLPSTYFTRCADKNFTKYRLYSFLTQPYRKLSRTFSKKIPYPHTQLQSGRSLFAGTQALSPALFRLAFS